MWWLRRTGETVTSTGKARLGWRLPWGRLLLAGLALLLAACGPRPEGPEQRAAFLARHWKDPLPAQGPVPEGFSALESALGAEACGQCHAAQRQDWQGSRHAHSMGPGLRWQLHLMNQAQANRCLRCHAPLAEQKALLAQAMSWPARPGAPPPAHVPSDLAQQGLVCAACHVREHRRYGPPVRPASAAAAADPRPHAGFVASTAFSDSAFCAPCHQFPADGPRTAGKLHEDTFEQWKASPLAARSSCQSCHMPERRHLWRGIHDAPMTRRAIKVDWRVQRQPDQRLVALVKVRNVGAGHHFPTYMVPKVELQIDHVAADGRRSAQAAGVIGWTVETDLGKEIADTRIPAGQERSFELPLKAGAAAGGLFELRLVVKPGEHYERTFVQSLARADRLPPASIAPLREALAQVRAGEYELMRLTRPADVAN